MWRQLIRRETLLSAAVTGTTRVKIDSGGIPGGFEFPPIGRALVHRSRDRVARLVLGVVGTRPGCR